MSDLSNCLHNSDPRVLTSAELDEAIKLYADCVLNPTSAAHHNSDFERYLDLLEEANKRREAHVAELAVLRETIDSVLDSLKDVS